jgi:hypothetical protein
MALGSTLGNEWGGEKEVVKGDFTRDLLTHAQKNRKIKMGKITREEEKETFCFNL